MSESINNCTRFYIVLNVKLVFYIFCLQFWYMCVDRKHNYPVPLRDVLWHNCFIFTNHHFNHLTLGGGGGVILKNFDSCVKLYEKFFNKSIDTTCKQSDFLHITYIHQEFKQ